MENYCIKTRKITIIPSGDNRNDVYSYIRKMASDLARIGNGVIRLHFNNQYDIDEISKSRNITKSDAKKFVEEKLGTSIRNSGYQSLTELIDISSNIRTSFNSLIFKTTQNNFFDVLTGKMSIPSFRKTNINIPFQFKGDAPFSLDEKEYYYFNLPSTKHTKETIGELKLSLFFGKDRSNNRIIVERILSGEYEICDSSIQVKDKDLFLLLTYKQPISEKLLKPEKVMGIDIGINRPVSFYISDEKHQPRQFNLNEHIQHERLKLLKQRKSLQQSLKFSVGGHGRNRKLVALNVLKEKELRWAKNKNHQITKAIIDIALQYGVGVIKMEDLTGITQDTKNYFLKSWAYYQLQSFLEYKAKSYGIKILWVDPKNTSRTCPVCGNVDKENRHSTVFKCVNESCPDHDVEKDADIVAALNISKSIGSDVKPKSKKGIISAKTKQKDIVEA
jgi:IS605 OrfB family transposase